MKKMILVSLLTVLSVSLHCPNRAFAEEEVGTESFENIEEAGDSFSDADFSDADFSDADFSNADVSDAPAVSDASGAADDGFSDADFSDADFSDADFSDAELNDTALEGTDVAAPEKSSDTEEFDTEEFDLEELNEPEPKNSIVEEPMTVPPAEEPQTPEPQFAEPDFSTPDFTAPEESGFAEMAPPAAPDAPDLQYEARLHDIYVNFLSEKTPDSEWRNLVGTRDAERYQIQTGDNLWDISKTLFGDGNYWPKIWSLNGRQITNPHLISPQNTIRFILGDESGPPAFTVTETDSTGAGDSADVESDEVGRPEVSMEPDIPPPQPHRPVVMKLPPSLPEWQDVSSVSDSYDDLGIDYGRRKILDVLDTIPLNGYISEKAPEALGKVSEIEAGSSLASALQYVYVSMQADVAQIGDTYLVIHNVGELQSVHPSIKGFLGYSIEVQGEVQLVERVPGRAGAGGDELYRAIVTKIVNPVSVDSSLISGKVENISLTEEGPRSQVVAQIIGGLFFNRRQVYGPESVAFLNKGSNDGLEPGQLLSVRENRLIRNEDTLVAGNVRPIGWMKVVRVTPRFATCVVVRAWSDILTGDITGAGEFQVNAPTGDSSQTASRSLLDELDGGSDAATSPDGAVDDFGSDEFDQGQDDFSNDDFSGDDFSGDDFSDEGF